MESILFQKFGSCDNFCLDQVIVTQIINDFKKNQDNKESDNYENNKSYENRM